MSTVHQPDDSADDTVPIMVRMPRSIFTRFRQIQEAEGHSRARMALRMIENDIERREQATATA